MIPEGLAPGDASVFHSQDASFFTELAAVPSQSVDKIVVFEVIPDDTCAAELFRVLKPLGKVMVDGISTREVGQSLTLDLKIQGFTDIMAAKDPETDRRFLVAQKAAIASEVVKVTIPVNTQSLPSTKWKMSTSDLAESELVDEDALLEAGKLPDDYKPAASCGEVADGGKKRACANCTCGLAEEEAKAGSTEPKTVEEKLVKASGCGNCAKGDAFRCGGCPFLGKPAFEPGQEKLILSLGDDDI